MWNKGLPSCLHLLDNIETKKMNSLQIFVLPVVLPLLFDKIMVSSFILYSFRNIEAKHQFRLKNSIVAI